MSLKNDQNVLALTYILVLITELELKLSGTKKNYSLDT